MKRAKKKFKLWELKDVKKILPLVRSIMTSIREHWLNKQNHDINIKRLEQKQGRPTRDEMISIDELRRQSVQEADQVEESVIELQNLGVLCFDPVQGIAGFPFNKYNKEGLGQRAWFGFQIITAGSGMEDDLFWRYESDTVDTRRSIRSLETNKCF